jgi:serpin B
VALCCGALALGDEPQVTSAPTIRVATAINDFGFRLLRALTPAPEGNVIISPLSVSLGLAMARSGAAGETKSAMARTLAVAPFNDEELNRGNRALLEVLERADPAVRIEIANALWAQSGFPINPDFLKLSERFYEAAVDSLDFAQDPQKAADTINAWVNRKTRGKIPTIVHSADRTTRLIITDAVYFKGRWTSPFDKKATERGPFYLPGGATAEVPLMVQIGKYPYFETDSFQAVRLPYGNQRFAMYVFLPRKRDGLPGLMGSLDQRHWSEWTGRFAERKGRITLPRLHLSYAKSLNDPLKSMGMAVAFDSMGADFSRIHPPPPPLFIQDVQHKTYVELDEKGTRAAAVTSVEIGVAMAQINEPAPFEMVVNHPFFCAIAEQQSGALLFAGIVTNPAHN